MIRYVPMAEVDAIRLRRLEQAVLRMHYADDVYGCGFYNEASWLGPYEDTRELVGLEPQ